MFINSFKISIRSPLYINKLHISFLMTTLYIYIYKQIYIHTHTYIYLFASIVWLGRSFIAVCRLFTEASGLLPSCGTQALEHAGSVGVPHRLSCTVACGILVPWPGSNCISCAGRWILNPWTAKEVPTSYVFLTKIILVKPFRDIPHLDRSYHFSVFISYLLRDAPGSRDAPC